VLNDAEWRGAAAERIDRLDVGREEGGGREDDGRGGRQQSIRRKSDLS
jgi:hypothetical protein